MTITIRPAVSLSMHPIVADILEYDVAHGNYGDVRAILGLNPLGDDNPYSVYEEDTFVILAERVYNLDIDRDFHYPGPDYAYRLRNYRTKLLMMIVFCIARQSGLLIH